MQDENQPASATFRYRAVRAVVLGVTMTLMLFVAAVLLSANGRPSALVESAEDLVSAESSITPPDAALF